LQFERETFTFVDESRATEDPNDVRDAPSRALATDVYVPEGNGPFPLIVHSHGASGHPRKFTELLGAWARHGYVVVAPAFPLTNDRSGGPTVVTDFVQQPADVAFVLEQVLALAAEDGNVLSGRVDTERIGASGLSLGGATTYGFVFDECCREERIDAAIVMSGIRLPFEDDTPDWPSTPLLIFHGTADPVLRFPIGEEAYRNAAPPKYFVTLHGALHPEAYEDIPSVHDEIVADVTLAFWDTYLRGDETARERIAGAATVPGTSDIDAQEE
jgi:dienelactone hydrolase